MAVSSCQDTDTLPSSDPEDSNTYYEDQVCKYFEFRIFFRIDNFSPIFQDDTDCDHIFIKQNNQFVSVKAHEVAVHATSHLQSPVKKQGQRRQSREHSETEYDRDMRAKNPLKKQQRSGTNRR